MRPVLPDGPVAVPASLVDSRPPFLWRAVAAADRFVRLHFWGFTFFLVLLGACSVTPDPSLGRLGLILGVAALFHNFAYVLNDVVDLPVDRTQPSRRDDFLVRGDVTPRQALVFALLQVPAAVGLSLWAGVDPRGISILAAAFVLMAIYNLWGKKCFFPPLTDLVQGLGWGGLVLYGAFACGGEPNVATWGAFIAGAGFIFLINGVHGGLRDLDNDLAQGSRTTAIYFGERPGRGAATTGPGLTVFAVGGQLLLIAGALWMIFADPFAYEPRKWMAVAALQIFLQALNLVYMVKVFRIGNPSWGRDFRLHLFLLLLAPALFYWPAMEGTLRFLFPLAFVGPFLLIEVTGELVSRWTARARRMLSPPSPAD